MELISLAALTLFTQDTSGLLCLPLTEGLSVPPVTSGFPQLTYSWQCLKQQITQCFHQSSDPQEQCEGKVVGRNSKGRKHSVAAVTAVS